MDFDHVRGAKVANLAKLRGGRAAWSMIVGAVSMTWKIRLAADNPSVEIVHSWLKFRTGCCAISMATVNAENWLIPK